MSDQIGALLRPSARPKRKVNLETRIVQKREKENELRARWGNQVQYYQNCDKQTSQYESWTSPRYYQSNNQLVENLKETKNKEENLLKRREKLRKLFEEEDRSYAIELTVKNRNQMKSAHKEAQLDFPTQLLNEVYLGVRLDEERKRQHEAELKLYQQWRTSNPIVRDYERAQTSRQLKMSWLDRQIEKRMETEQAEQEAQLLLQERDERLKLEQKKVEENERLIREKNLQLQNDLETQMNELRMRKKTAERLRTLEQNERKQLAQLHDLEREFEEAERKRSGRVLALCNLRHHKLRLKERALIIKDNLDSERKLMEKILNEQLHEVQTNEERKKQLQEAAQQFVAITKSQQDLEKQREKCLDFVFDSEAKNVWENQEEIWRKEEESRHALVQDVLKSLRQQIEENVEKVRQQQIDQLKERERILATIEEHDQQMKVNEEALKREKIELQTQITSQVQEKSLQRKQMQLLEQKRIQDQLDEALKEEARLRNEIMELQRRPAPSRSTRTQILF